MAGKKNKKGNDDSGGAGAPLWMVTFGDLMSLLLTFFVLLLSFSSIQMVEFQKAMGSLKGALGVLPKNESIISPFNPVIPRISGECSTRYNEKVKELKELIKEKALSDQISVEFSEGEMLIRIESPVLFAIGKAQLKPQAYSILDKIIEITTETNNRIRIEGHTDNIPIHTPQYPSNWELSTARALSVLRYFLGSGRISPERLAAVGYGQYHPLVPNDSPENRSKNRRVEIYISSPEKKLKFKEEIY